VALTAKSLVLDLLSTMPPGYPVPVGALVRACAAAASSSPTRGASIGWGPPRTP